MSYIDVTGKTEEEAVRKALTSSCGMDRDDVSLLKSWSVPRAAFWASAGQPARIRVTYGTDEPEAKNRPAHHQAGEEAGTQGRGEEARVSPNPRSPGALESRRRPRPAEKAAGGRRPRRSGVLRRRQRPPHHASSWTGLLQHMNSPAQVKVTETEKGRYQVVLEGEKLGQLIGRRGETLDAIQQLTNYAVNPGAGQARPHPCGRRELPGQAGAESLESPGPQGGRKGAPSIAAASPWSP